MASRRTVNVLTREPSTDNDEFHAIMSTTLSILVDSNGMSDPQGADETLDVTGPGPKWRPWLSSGRRLCGDREDPDGQVDLEPSGYMQHCLIPSFESIVVIVWYLAADCLSVFSDPFAAFSRL